MDDGPADPAVQFDRQVVILVSTVAKGVSVDPGFDLIALSETHTGRVRLDDVLVSTSDLVAGPVDNALASLNKGPFNGQLSIVGFSVGRIGCGDQLPEPTS